MKVLIWSQYFWPENFHINAVARSLHEQGIEVTVLTGKPNYPEGKIFEGYKALGIHYERYAGFDVVRIPLRQRGKNSGKGMVLNYLSFIVSGYLCAPYALRGKKFDLFLVYAPSPLLQALPALYLSWLKRVPLVLWVQDLWPEALLATGFIKNKLILSLVKHAVKYIYYCSDSILIQCEAFRKSVESLTSRKNKIIYFPNSAECHFQNSKSINSSGYLSKAIAQQFSVVFAGNIGVAQSCETIVEAAKILKNFEAIKFYLVGSGRMDHEIAKLITHNELDNIVMAGRVTHDQMPAIYESASVLLLTLKDQTALSATVPSKLQAYLSAMKPIIACCNGEAADIVKKADAGLTCAAGDAKALADAVIKLYEMTQEARLQLGQNAQQYFLKHFQLYTCTERLISHFKKTLNEHAN